MTWTKLLDTIRSGKAPIEVGENGLPAYVTGMPYYELMELIAALTAGYMRNYNIAKNLRNYIKKEMEGTET